MSPNDCLQCRNKYDLKMELRNATCVKETATKKEHEWGEDQSSLTVWKDMEKTQQQRIRCELHHAHSETVGNFAMKAELSCSISISVPITILSRRHRKIKKLCSDILNMVCSKVISRAFHTGKDWRRVQK
ncbi:uncharacterized protein LJ264_010181 isoform 1-T1 [Porphyrio hochstetteri]